VLAVGLVTLATVGTACSSSGSTAPPTTAVPTASTGTTPSSAPPVPSAGCSIPVAPVATGPLTNQRENIEVDGASRWYLLNLPATTTPSPVPVVAGSPGRPRPLVIDFHGLAEGATIHSDTTGFGTLGQQDGFIAVFPNGTGSPVHWDTTAQTGNQDLDFVSAMLQQLESTQCIDTSRVYASGFSDGSFFVSLLACTMSNRFAAIAAVSGLQLDKPCRTTRPVPILTFHGTADPILYFNGGIGTGTLDKVLGSKSPAGSGTSGSTTTTTLPKADLHGPGYPATVQAWAVKDGCDPHSTDTRQSSQVIVRRYACPAGTDVEFYIVLGGGHAWPGSAFSREISSLTGFTTFQIDATHTIWSFFQRFTLPS
jgi:polyhydroxybutyrate depolymerase